MIPQPTTEPEALPMPEPIAARQQLTTLIHGCMLALALLIPSLALAQAPGTSKQLRAVVSIQPLKGLVQPILDAAQASPPAAGTPPAGVEVLVPVGESEHGFEIPPSKLKLLSQADLVVTVGLGLDAQVQKFLAQNPSPDRRMVEFASVVGESLAEHDHTHDHTDHDHVHGDQCNHASDPHLWLDPILVDRLVDSIGKSVLELVGSDTARQDRVKAATAATRTRVMSIHETYAVKIGSFKTRTIVVGHDAWGRLAARYGLETMAIAGLDASEPAPKALQAAAAAVKEKGLTTLFAEPQLSDKAIRRIAESTKAQVRKLDPLGDGDWFKLMESNLAELERAQPTLQPVAPAAAPAR